MIRSFDLSLYLVTDQRSRGHHLDRVVRDAVAGGVSLVQLRDHHSSDAEMYRTTCRLLDVLADTGVPLVVNDRVDVALAAGAQGVHLGQGDLPADRVRDLAGPDVVIGLTTSTPAEVEAAEAYGDGVVDYLGLSPFLATLTKPDAAEPLGLEGLRALRRATALPCVAIGGVNTSNAADVVDTGVDGIAVVSAICAAGDARAAAAALRRCIDR
ncbi:MAG: thiamine phosphate synthase [Streptosporangiales bacterium]|nr:thiamine phosphate synthase [Streptosporangiales bacterium]